jgi:2-hydroxy-6-oxonona-2,4-dienedioate hydrolase
VEAMKQLADTLEIERAAFVGNSMGGGISVGFTATHPDRISHLITMGSGVPGTNLFQPAGLSEGIRILVEAYEDPSPENFKRIVNIMCYDASFATDELAEQRSHAAHEFPEHNRNWLEIFRAGLNAPSAEIVPKLMTSTVPALIIHGRDDRTVPFESSLRLVSLIPNARLVLFNRCAHWAQLEHAAEFCRLVDDFVSNN